MSRTIKLRGPAFFSNNSKLGWNPQSKNGDF